MSSTMTLKRLCLFLLICANYTQAKEITLKADLLNPILLANQKQKTVIKVGLEGFILDQNKKRPPVNISIVMDKSSSMQGEKIEKAKEAAIQVLRGLNERDIFSFITYDSVVDVLIPATKLSDKESIVTKIKNIQASGSTALFGGVSKGLQETKKFNDLNYINRIVLLSDGQANIGPSTPHELGQLGYHCAKEGISVTTIGLGLGYNEDLMARLAYKSDGNHGFAENANDIAKLFQNELGNILSTVAQNIQIKIECQLGVKPIRVIDQESRIEENLVYFNMSQIYSGLEKYILLEVELPAREHNSKLILGKVNVTYHNLDTNKKSFLSRNVEASFNQSKEIVSKNENQDIALTCFAANANYNNQKAIQLLDQGKKEEAKAMALFNRGYIDRNKDKVGNQVWKDLDEGNLSLSDTIKNPKNYNSYKKKATQRQQSIRSNNSINRSYNIFQKKESRNEVKEEPKDETKNNKKKNKR